MESERLLGPYIAIRVNRNIILGRISVKHIYENSSIDDTCARVYIKCTMSIIVSIESFVVKKLLYALLDHSRSLSLSLLHSLCLPNYSFSDFRITDYVLGVFHSCFRTCILLHPQLSAIVIDEGHTILCADM